MTTTQIDRGLREIHARTLALLKTDLGELEPFVPWHVDYLEDSPVPFRIVLRWTAGMVEYPEFCGSTPDYCVTDFYRRGLAVCRVRLGRG